MYQGNDKWEFIVEYPDVPIKAGPHDFTKSFELYRSRDGELAWSPPKDGLPHINPQGIRVVDSDVLHIGNILAEVVYQELKTPKKPEPALIVRQNKDLVSRILNDIRKS